VRQGGIIDGLLQRLYESGVGCYIGNVFIGALAYADDVVLLDPTHSAMGRMLRVCEDFAKDFCVKFNPTKSMCMFVYKTRSKGLGTEREVTLRWMEVVCHSLISVCI